MPNCLHVVQILEETIKTRWNALPEEQQKAIRSFLSNVIISVATSTDSLSKQRVYLQKLNVVLVQVWLSILSVYSSRISHAPDMCQVCLAFLQAFSMSHAAGPEEGLACQMASVHP